MATLVAFAALMTLAAMAVVLVGARPGARRGGVVRTEANVAVLRQQLRALEDEYARNLIAATQFEAMQDDLQRRLLLEAPPAEMPAAVSGSRWPPIAAAALLPLVAAAVYAAVGSPSMAERADAPSMAQLEAHVTSSPNDARAWVLLARLRMDDDRFAPATAAYARAIEVSPKVAGDAQIWAEYADALGMAQGGTLAGKPRAAIDRALALSPAQPKALELAGSAAYEARDFRAAHAHWSALLAQLPDGSPQRAQLAVALARTGQLARLSSPAD